MSIDRWARFLTVGLVNTITGLLVIFACKWWLGMGDIASNLVGYGVGVVLGFVLNKNWTFDFAGGYGRAFARYLAVLCLAYGVNLITMLQAINLLHLNSYLAQAVGIVPYTVIGYAGSRFFVFPRDKELT